MKHSCENCDLDFTIERHKSGFVGSHRYIICGTGRNMIYKGDMNREYAMCPDCGVVEQQFSAEARDQSEPFPVESKTTQNNNKT